MKGFEGLSDLTGASDQTIRKHAEVAEEGAEDDSLTGWILYQVLENLSILLMGGSRK